MHVSVRCRVIQLLTHYNRQVRKRFPTMTLLDGVDVDPSIVVTDGPKLDVPAPLPGYAPPEIAQSIAEFVVKYVVWHGTVEWSYLLV